MADLLGAYFKADHIGSVLVVAAVFAVVKHSERLLQVRKDPNG
ncbi:hypothetical protein [Arthrobacter terrae]|nr:hypothetical protein [Arthrobacter terrae]